MYGLVNKAIEDYITHTFGSDVWEQILEKSQVPEEAFVSLEAYPDKLAYDLVGSASAVLGLPPDTILTSFGEHWIHFTGRQGYGHLLTSCGRNLPEFLKQLDNMHGRVGLTFGYSTMPSFKCRELSPGLLQVDYYSQRPGLGPMVVGLLKGLGPLFNTTVEVEYLQSRSSGADHDQYLVRYTPN